MEKELPKNWVDCSLGEIIQTKKGKKPSSTIDYPKEGYIPYILIDEMEGKPIRSYTNDSKVSIVNKDEVLLVWDGSIGKCGSGLAGAIGSTLVALKPLSNIPTKFIEYTIIDKNSFIKQTSTGTGLQHINKDFFNDCRIGLPPLPEQNRIVAKLDTLFAQLETIKKCIVNVPLLLKDFRQQVLTKAVTGKLTDEYKNINNLNTWKESILKDVCTRITVGYVGKTVDKYRETGIPFLRSQNVRAFKYDDNNLMFIDEDFHNQIKKSSISAGDVAIVRSGYPGTTCVIPKEIQVANCSDILVLTTIPEYLNPHFVAIFMNSEIGKEIVFQGKVGMAQQHFNTKKLQETIINLPSIIEQQEIVSRVESLFTKADAIEKQYEYLKAKIDSLPQAILHKAFKGELTKQLESDGDARQLLREIQELKNKTIKSKKK